MASIERTSYLAQLIQWRDKHVIKIITGIRRCGKSTLMMQFQQLLRDEKVSEKQIISVNLEDLAFENLKDYRELYRYITARMVSGKMNYIFLDEIQSVEMFQKAIDSLFLKENVDIYLTGSNAYLLSGEISTLLSGRYIEIEVLPFSMKEFKATTDAQGEQLYRNYIGSSSFPYTINLSSGTDLRQYLQGIYSTVILKDIIQRSRMQDSDVLERVIRYLADNIGNVTSLKSIADTLTSNGRKSNPHTIENCVNGLLDSYMFYTASRYDVHGKEHLRVGNKYYLVDIGLRNLLLGIRPNDFGHILENIVYLELRRRGNQVFVGKVGKQEVDFVCLNGEDTAYYQVALSTREESTLQRELSPLEAIKDHYPKYLLTLDADPVSSHNGIKKQNVIDWLLQ
ncbi:MAG: ATP-binding protein [Bacteroidales bacterium]|nr:ATP-binding protein [Bacteroidales bacterium]